MINTDTMTAPADHGGGIDAAVQRWGGARAGWIDLSTGINPQPYPLPALDPAAWNALPDGAATDALETAARQFWRIPEGAAVLAAPGASALIARIPNLAPPARVHIPRPTYNEHARAFAAHGWTQSDGNTDGTAEAAVIVHPNNPDGRRSALPDAPLTIVDESFCDTHPNDSHIAQATRPGVLILKSFGKFWGLAGLRLGFAIGDAALIAALKTSLGPWPVSGPALVIGRDALRDTAWADATRARLNTDAARLDALMAMPAKGTPLFRLYDTEDAAAWQDHLGRHQVLTRIFPYSTRLLRLGLPGTPADWARLEHAVRAR